MKGNEAITVGETLKDFSAILQIFPLLPKESRGYLRGYFEGLIAARQAQEAK